MNKIFFPVSVGLAALACTLYCAILWAPGPMAWTDPDSSILCWFFCSSLAGKRKEGAMLFGAATVFMALTSLFAAWALARGMRWGRYLLMLSGFVLFPLGLVNFIPLYLENRKPGG